MAIDFATRSNAPEQMDDFAIDDERLTDSLAQLRVVNRWLGGYSVLMGALAPYLRKHAYRVIRILDIGAGSGDFAEFVVKWASSQAPAISVEFYVTDANPATVAFARKCLDRHLGKLASSVHTEVADAMKLPYGTDSFDIVTASMFLHHFADEDAATVLANMKRVARDGIIVNDLHRHPLAYYGFAFLAQLCGATEMVKHDGPLSVLRGFSRRELTRIAHRAEIASTGLQWRWAFRWVLSTIENHE